MAEQFKCGPRQTKGMPLQSRSAVRFGPNVGAGQQAVAPHWPTVLRGGSPETGSRINRKSAGKGGRNVDEKFLGEYDIMEALKLMGSL